MKKLLALFFLTAAFTLTVSAQKKDGFKLNVAGEYAIPLKSSPPYSNGVGASAKLETPLIQSLYFTAAAGYMVFIEDTRQFVDDFTIENAKVFPLQGGFKYYIIPQFYTEVTAGKAISTKRSYGGYSGMAYGAGIGLAVPLNGDNAIDFGVRYEKWPVSGDGINFIGLRVAYKFRL